MFELPASQTRLARSDSSPRHARDREGLRSFPPCFICPYVCCGLRSTEEQSCIPGQQAAGGEETETGRHKKKPCIRGLSYLLHHSLCLELKQCMEKYCKGYWKPVEQQ